MAKASKTIKVQTDLLISLRINFHEVNQTYLKGELIENP